MTDINFLPNANVTVDLTVEMLQETLIALRDREATIVAELLNPATGAVVAAICSRQHSRVMGCIAGIEDAIEGAQLKLNAKAA